MRTLCSALMLISAIGCSSSTNGTPKLRMPCEDSFNTIFSASRSAVIRLGGAVVHADRTSGSILGRIEADDVGFEVELTISLSRIPDNVPDTQEPLTVSVRAIEPGVSDPDPYRAEELRRLEKDYLALVRDRANCGSPY